MDMCTIQDLDLLVERVRRLCEADPQVIAADPQSVTDLRAAWAEAAFLEAELVPMAFTEYDQVVPERFHEHAFMDGSRRWDKGFQHLYQSAKSLPWSTTGLGEAEENPIAWLLMVMAIRHRAGAKLELVNKALKPGRTGR